MESVQFSKYYLLFLIDITVFFLFSAATTDTGRLGRLQGLCERRNETGCPTTKLDLNTDFESKENCVCKKLMVLVHDLQLDIHACIYHGDI